MWLLQFATLLLVLTPGFTYLGIRSCEDVSVSGFYTLNYKSWSLDVICDADTDGGGWLVILNRKGGYEDFYQHWTKYADYGIGSPPTEYILPLRFLNEYLSLSTFEMLEEMREGNEEAWALHSYFLIGSEEEKFKLQVGAYEPTSTTGGDNLAYENKMKFSTFDQDNDLHSNSCA